MGVLAPSLHIESTDSMVNIHADVPLLRESWALVLFQQSHYYLSRKSCAGQERRICTVEGSYTTHSVMAYMYIYMYTRVLVPFIFMLAYLNQQCENKEQNPLKKKVDNIDTNPRTSSG